MRLTILDAGDNYTYNLDISLEDALKIYNIKNLRKSLIDLPSIDGNASIMGNDVTIMYENGGNGHESINVPLTQIQMIIDVAMQRNNEEDE